jgi:amidase
MIEDRETALVGRTASELAQDVQAGRVTPVEVVRAHLEHIAALDGRVGAFQLVRRERALAEAEQLEARPDLADLPLAGVPIGVKDNTAVEGEPKREGSPATPGEPQPEDAEVVRRLRAAGAIVVGITRMPELGVWGTSDGAFGVARNPWNLDKTPGGSSGGSAAAVAAAMVPAAHANDGMGSIRIPAANCGLFGLKPGSGVMPRQPDASDWNGLTENGAVATTVQDVALLISVMADRSDLRDPGPPDGPLRIAVSTKAPAAGVRVDRHLREATEASARLLAGQGHHIATAHPPHAVRDANTLLVWWCVGVAGEAESLDPRKLEPRNRRMAAVGRLDRRLGLFKQQTRDRFRERMKAFFEAHDLLLTPALARPAISSRMWSKRGWLANLLSNAWYAPFAAPWNVAGFPAASVPAGMHPSGLPMAVQIVGAPGAEGSILQLAAQLETLRPWPRHAPLAGVS